MMIALISICIGLLISLIFKHVYAIRMMNTYEEMIDNYNKWIKALQEQINNYKLITDKKEIFSKRDMIDFAKMASKHVMQPVTGDKLFDKWLKNRKK